MSRVEGHCPFSGNLMLCRGEYLKIIHCQRNFVFQFYILVNVVEFLLDVRIAEFRAPREADCEFVETQHVEHAEMNQTVLL